MKKMSTIENLFSQKRRIRKAAKKQNAAPQAAELEVLEERQLMAGDMIGVVRSGAMNGFDGWYMNTDNDRAHEIDQLYGYNDETFVIGDWFGTGDRTGVVREGDNGLLQWHFDRDGDATAEGSRQYGFNSDIPVVGDWNGDGKTDLGAVRKGSDGLLNWYLDTNGDTTHDIHYKFGLNSGHTPVVGDWDSDGRDEIGVFDTNGHFHMNTDGDVWAERIVRGGKGFWTPVTGDFDGDGYKDDIGYVRPGSKGYMKWSFDHNADGKSDRSIYYGLNGDAPVVGSLRHAEVDVEQIKDGRWTPLYDGSGRQHAFEAKASLQGSEGLWNRIRIHNRGTETLTFYNASISSDFEMRYGNDSRIAPGRYRDVLIRLKTSSAGEKFGRLTFRTNDGGENPYDFQLRGVVTAPEIEVSNGSQDLIDGQSTVAVPTSYRGFPGEIQEITVHNSGSVPLDLTRVRVVGGQFKLLTASSMTLQPGKAQTVRVQTLTGSIGTKSGRLIMDSNDADESSFDVHFASEVKEPAPEIDIRLAGRSLTDGQSVIDFANAMVGQPSVSLSLAIKNPGQLPLVVRGIDLPNGLRTDSHSFTVPANGSHHITLTMDTDRVRQLSGELRLHSNDASESTFNVRVSGSVEAAAPEIDVSYTRHCLLCPVQPQELQNGRNTIEFRSENQGTELGDRHYFSIANSGNAPLHIARISVPRGFRLVGSAPTEIPAGSSASIEVELDLGTAGDFSGNLVVQSNDTDERSFGVRLRGSVPRQEAPPEVEFRVNNQIVNDSTAFDFGGLVGSQTATHSVTIRNHGEQPLRLSGLQHVLGYIVTGIAEGQTLGRHERTIITITPDQSLGEKIGTLSFRTNDADEGHFSISLRAKRYPPRTFAAGSPNHASRYEVKVTDPNHRFEIAPAHGGTNHGQRFVLIWNNGARSEPFSRLSELVLTGSHAGSAIVENWTSVRVRRTGGFGADELLATGQPAASAMWIDELMQSNIDWTA